MHGTAYGLADEAGGPVSGNAPCTDGGRLRDADTPDGNISS